MKEKLNHMTYAELPHTYDAWHHLNKGFLTDYEDDVEIFAGISTGKRTDRIMEKMYDADIAEISGDRMAMKAKYRRRRKDARKHKELPEHRKFMKERRKDVLYGYYYNENCKKVMGHPDSLPINYRKSAEGEKILRSDWDAEIEDIIEDLDWAFFDAEYLDEKIEFLERCGLEKGDNYPRWNRLWDRLHVVNEVIRANRFVEEMLNDEYGFHKTEEEEW